MNIGPDTSVLHFEVYALVTMKFGMTNRESRMEAKLAEHGLSWGDAEAIGERMAQTVGGGSAFFSNWWALLGVGEESASVEFSSVLWPEFDFEAVAGPHGVIESAGYKRVRGRAPAADSPEGLPTWSVGVPEFAERFGPVALSFRSSLGENVLPAHEQYAFEWNGEQYAAGFSWGLFLFAAKLWPED